MSKRKPANKIRSRQSSTGQLRIIGGEWRSRRLPIITAEGLRPTPDRVRETLFNWLQARVPGAVCLDLFAGSGALGFEALSRDASQLVMVETNPQAFHCLQANALALKIDEKCIQLFKQDALSYLDTTTQQFDLVFVDPPYGKGLAAQVMRLLLDRRLLKPAGLVYLETEMDYDFDADEWGMQVVRETSAGLVAARLLQLQA